MVGMKNDGGVGFAWSTVLLWIPVGIRLILVPNWLAPPFRGACFGSVLPPIFTPAQAKFSYSADENVLTQIGSSSTMNNILPVWYLQLATMALVGYVIVSSLTMTS